MNVNAHSRAESDYMSTGYALSPPRNPIARAHHGGGSEFRQMCSCAKKSERRYGRALQEAMEAIGSSVPKIKNTRKILAALHYRASDNGCDHDREGLDRFSSTDNGAGRALKRRSQVKRPQMLPYAIPCPERVKNDAVAQGDKCEG
jgi:hypothetical protein